MTYLVSCSVILTTSYDPLLMNFMTVSPKFPIIGIWCPSFSALHPPPAVTHVHAIDQTEVAVPGRVDRRRSIMSHVASDNKDG